MKIKKILAATLAATMVMASALTVCAAGSGSAAPAESTGSSNSEGTTSQTINLEEQKSAGSTIKLAGSNAKTTVAGAYSAKKVQGVVVNTAASEIKAALNLTGDQTPYIIVYDTDTKKSNKAMDSVNAAITALGGGNIEATLNIELGAKSAGKFVSLKDGSVGTVVGLPKNTDTTKTVSVICVRPGGEVTVLEDQDSNPKTVTFEVKAGLGTYSIITK